MLGARCAADLFSKNVRIMKKRSLPHPIPRFIGSVRGFHLAYYSYFGLFLRSFHGQLDPLHLDSEESDPPRPTFWLSKRKSEPVKEALYFVDLTFLWKGLHARLQWLKFFTDYVNYSWVDMVASFEFWLLSVAKKRDNKFTHWIDIISTVLSRVNRYLRL